MGKKKTIRDVVLDKKRVLVRVDFNVPLDKTTGAITDDTRIRACLPTIRYLIDNKAKVILCSHLGRPDGKVVEGLRLAPVAERLSQLLGQPVMMAPDCIGPQVEAAVDKLRAGDVMLLENLRFHPEEEKSDLPFAKALARLADLYVNDAFGTAHRAHASTVAVARYLPAVAGFLMQRELEIMGRALNSPRRPLAALIGGAKVSDKIGLLANMAEKVDLLAIGGGMACTFLKAMGNEMGQSLVDEDRLDFVRRLMESAKGGIKPLLPIDIVVADSLDGRGQVKTVPVTEVPPSWYVVDIGEQTIALFSKELRKCKTVIWNGPMGIHEVPRFAVGTQAMARLLADLPATTIIGGGSTAEAVEEMGLAKKMAHVSTGGGASLRFLGGASLPGVEVLLDKEQG